ncbi:hypothetical protein PR048_020574 [Dryococelus australis]|uniref:Uncharacterized protein n=1 Tax=Dryococelus australis TaxID=614101 RepID=A0ABQ9H731_9NEOP|nr:hypothetical protein PR048_020574 [Dryococelus australis]
MRVKRGEYRAAPESKDREERDTPEKTRGAVASPGSPGNLVTSGPFRSLGVTSAARRTAIGRAAPGETLFPIALPRGSAYDSSTSPPASQFLSLCPRRTLRQADRKYLLPPTKVNLIVADDVFAWEGFLGDLLFPLPLFPTSLHPRQLSGRPNLPAPRTRHGAVERRVKVLGNLQRKYLGLMYSIRVVKTRVEDGPLRVLEGLGVMRTRSVTRVYSYVRPRGCIVAARCNDLRGEQRPALPAIRHFRSRPGSNGIGRQARHRPHFPSPYSPPVTILPSSPLVFFRPLRALSSRAAAASSTLRTRPHNFPFHHLVLIEDLITPVFTPYRSNLTLTVMQPSDLLCVIAFLVAYHTHGRRNPFLLGTQDAVVVEFVLPGLYRWGDFLKGTTMAERLAYLPPTKAIQVQSPAGSLRIFARGNRAGRRRWSAGFLGDLPEKTPRIEFSPVFPPGARGELNVPPPPFASTTRLPRGVCACASGSVCVWARARQVSQGAGGREGGADLHLRGRCPRSSDKSETGAGVIWGCRCDTRPTPAGPTPRGPRWTRPPPGAKRGRSAPDVHPGAARERTSVTAFIFGERVASHDRRSRSSLRLPLLVLQFQLQLQRPGREEWVGAVFPPPRLLGTAEEYPGNRTLARVSEKLEVTVYVLYHMLPQEKKKKKKRNNEHNEHLKKQLRSFEMEKSHPVWINLYRFVHAPCNACEHISPSRPSVLPVESIDYRPAVSRRSLHKKSVTSVPTPRARVERSSGGAPQFSAPGN